TPYHCPTHAAHLPSPLVRLEHLTPALALKTSREAPLWRSRQAKLVPLPVAVPAFCDAPRLGSLQLGHEASTSPPARAPSDSTTRTAAQTLSPLRATWHSAALSRDQRIWVMARLAPARC